MINTLRTFIADESGATALEYGLIVALVSIAAGGVVMQLGDIAQLLYGYVASGVQSAAS
ncbi:MAG: Flp family type IVb pilin [Dongiaceae bacterium]